MDNTKGADRLIASIMEDAQAQADALEAQAANEAAAIRKKLDEDREKLRREFSERAEAERADTIRRAVTNAELEGRKELIAKKRELIDRAYSEAYDRLCAMKGAERDSILKKLLRTECEGGETVCPASADRETLSRLIGACGVPGLVLGNTEGGIQAGFVVKGSNFIKDCSFAALMESTRSETLERVAEILFE